MKWYLAKVVFRIICGDGEHAAQFDEQLRLIAATDTLSALEKAIALGKKEQENFMNGNQQLVQWKFVNISELLPLNNFTDGAELYSSVLETHDCNGYLKFIEHKAKGIAEENHLSTLQQL
ncbi:MAG: DUF4288 domain-containing protein [Bacteroidetes bacterium]|nr:DUF4288 domain-containing protein [Bacteroidota bacterium]